MRLKDDEWIGRAAGTVRDYRPIKTEAALWVELDRVVQLKLGIRHGQKDGQANEHATFSFHFTIYYLKNNA